MYDVIWACLVFEVSPGPGDLRGGFPWSPCHRFFLAVEQMVNKNVKHPRDRHFVLPHTTIYTSYGEVLEHTALPEEHTPSNKPKIGKQIQKTKENSRRRAIAAAPWRHDLVKAWAPC